MIMDIVSENMLMGCLILDNSRFGEVTRIIGGAGMFYEMRNADVYRAMYALWRDREPGVPLDMVRLKQKLEDLGLYDNAEGGTNLDHMIRLAEGVDPGDDPTIYAKYMRYHTAPWIKDNQ